MALLVLALAVAWVVAAALGLLSARRELLEGRREAAEARGRMDPAALADGRPLPALRRARADFAQGHRRLRAPLLAPVRALPVLGRQVRSASALSGAAETMTGVGVQAIEQARAILSLPRGSGPERVALVRQLGELAGRADAALTGVRLGPRAGLVTNLARARDQLAGELADTRAGLQRAGHAADAVVDLLAGPRRYLVFAANNAEMRAGSGMFLMMGELSAADGRVQLAEMRTVTKLVVPPGAVPLEGDLAGRWGWLQPNVEWRNLMLSPRFPLNSALATRMWAAAGGRPVDGVLALDPVLLRAVLAATGPVAVGGRTVGADQVVGDLLHDQYVRFRPEEQPERREELGELARAVLEAFDKGGWSTATMARELTAAARGRHILLWSSRPEEQSGWEAAGLDGSTTPDSLLVSVVNRGQNKLDQFQRITAELAVVPNGGTTWCTVTLRLTNTARPDEPLYIVGPTTPAAARGAYTGIVAVTLPARARGGRFDGVDSLAVAGADGDNRVVGYQLTIPPGRERRVVLRFEVPGAHGGIRVEPSARVPAIGWTALGATWDDEKARLVRW